MASSSRVPGRRAGALRRFAAASPVLALSLVLAGATAGCSGDHASGPAGTAGTGAAATATAHAAGPVVPRGDVAMLDTAELAAAWDARPEYVHAAHPDTRTAYAYALARPDVLQWLPCYCGCVGMGHGSNLDCFLEPRENGAPIAFEQHASVCDVCVRTALLAQRMIGDGRTMIEIRAAVDAEFGGLAPGTETELPPPA